MLALRRSSLPLRIRGFSIRACFPNSERPITSAQNESRGGGDLTSGRRLSLEGFPHASANIFLTRRSLTLQAGGNRGPGEEEEEEEEEYDDFEAGFSELEKGDGENEPFPEPEGANEEGDGYSLKSEVESSETHKKLPSHSALYAALVQSPSMSIRNVLYKWVEEGNALGCREIGWVINKLRKACMSGRALQVSLWLEEYKNYDFVEVDYVRRLLLIYRIHGPEKAREYFEHVPESFRGEFIYCTLLSIYALCYSVEKAEEVFDKMRSLGLPLTVGTCNHLLIMYKRTQKLKMKDVLLLMESENVKPSVFTYTLLIDTKGESNDLAGMERILEAMTSQGVEPDDKTRIVLAKHYGSAGFKDKAKGLLKQVNQDNRVTRRSLLLSYACLGEADEVRRILKACGPNPVTVDYAAAIAAWGRLNDIDEAEAVFERMLKASKFTSAALFILLLKVYVDHKMLAKGNELVNRMRDSGCRIGPWTWDLLARLYIAVGEIHQADAALDRAARAASFFKPKMSLYMAVMNQHSIRGDVHNAEKIFYRMREMGHPMRYPQFQALVLAYINAKKPVYGMRDRMKADNFHPNKTLAHQLELVDVFKKTSDDNLLCNLLD